jgi:superfamily II DNA or RNA helicase
MAVHKALDRYYSNGKVLEMAKQEFEYQWNKFKLDETKLRISKDTYWVMCLNGIQLNLDITSTEFKIFYPEEIVGNLDGISTHEDFIVDWKTSTRSDENEEEYRKQILLYSYLFNRKLGRIPKKAIIYYLKYSGSKGEMSFNFNEEDIKQIEKWYYEILEKMASYIEHPETLPPFNHDYYYSPYRAFWGTENGESIKFKIHTFGNYIQLEGPITELLEKGIKKKFSYELKNAHWIKKARPMAKTTVDFWNGRVKTLPLGFKDMLLKTLTDYADYKKLALDLDIIEHRQFDSQVLIMPDKFVNDKSLRDYQTEAVDVYMRRKIGILELGTGAGKTEIAIEIIRRLKCRSLFIVDKIELLRQTKKRIEDSLGIEVGEIGAGVDNIKDVTVATIQTLNKHLDTYRDYLKTIKFAIFDETHKVAAKSYVKISRYLTGAEFRLGLSGTAFRDDGNDMMIYAVTGPIVHQLNSKTLIERGWLVKPQIYFIRDFLPRDVMYNIEQESKTGLINESPVYSVYYNNFITNETHRNTKIIETVSRFKGKRILILTKLIDHGKLLNEMIPNSQHLYGDTNKEDREKMFKDFVEGTVPILISTISIFSEGIDIPELDIVINASANKGDVKTIQVLGRILRKLEGKKSAMYVDFYDESKFFRSASMSRRKALIKEGHDVSLVKEVL